MGYNCKKHTLYEGNIKQILPISREQYSYQLGYWSMLFTAIQ